MCAKKEPFAAKQFHYILNLKLGDTNTDITL